MGKGRAFGRALGRAMDSCTARSPSKVLIGSAAALGLTAAVWWPATAASTTAFYAGKELRFIIPDGAGGGYDAYYRLLARHLADHIPGHPNIVDENMPGASGLRATNWLYDLAPKDGTVMGATYNTLLTEPLLGDTATRYDATKFEWIGSIDTQYNACMVWYTSPIKTIEDAMKQEVKVSATGLYGNSAKVPLMLNKLIGTRFKVISGYSTTGARLAVERREVDGICGISYSTYQVANPEWLKDHKIRFILQDGRSKIKQLQNVPLLIDLVKDPKDRAALKVLDVGQEAGRPVLFPPGVPQDLLKTLRAAFDETMQDPKFLADAQHIHLDPQPITGQQIERDIKATYAAPKDIVALTAQLWPPATAPSPRPDRPRKNPRG
jgi:tripartite-type tricarboxylate transporter receptor subunit TctC